MIQIKTMERLVFFLVAAALFMPLVFIESSFVFPFIVPKVIYFRIVSALLLGCYLVLVAVQRKAYGIRLTGVNLAVLLFFLSFTISTFAGVSWYHSLWDGHERMLGLFTIFHYVVFYLAAANVIKQMNDWKMLLRWFLGIGMVVMFFALWQKFVDPDLFLNRGNHRVSSTLGNPIYLSAFGMFMVFMGAYLHVIEKTKKFHIYAISSVAVGLIGLFLGGSRGMLLGTLAGIGLSFFSYWFFYRRNKKVRAYFAGLFLIGVALLGILYANRTTTFVQNIPAVGRLLNTSFDGGFENNTRIMAWQVGMDGFKEKPLFGWGPNNYMLAFNQHYRPSFLRYGWQETWFDNAHNVLVNTLTVQGVVGLIAYLFLFVSAAMMIRNTYKRKEMCINEAILLNAFLLAHFVGNIFIFENPTSYLYFFFTLALIYARTRTEHPAVEGSRTQKLPAGVSATVLVVILLFIQATEINPARANSSSIGVIRALHSANFDAVTLLDQTLAIPTPHVRDIRADFARGILQNLNNFVAQDRVKARELLLRGFDELQKNKIHNKRDVRVYIDQATLAHRLAQKLQDTSLFVRSEEILEEGMQYSPKRQQFIYLLAFTKSALEKHDEARALLEQTVADDDMIGEGIWRLARVYEQVGELELAHKLLRDAEARGVSYTEQGRQNVESILAISTTEQ